MLEIRFKVDPDEQEILGQAIHDALQGSDAYITNDIILNIDEPDTVSLTLGDSNGASKAINVYEDEYEVEVFNDKASDLSERNQIFFEIMKLRNKGYSTSLIASHLSIPLEEVNTIVYGVSKDKKEGELKIMDLDKECE